MNRTRTGALPLVSSIEKDATGAATAVGVAVGTGVGVGVGDAARGVGDAARGVDCDTAGVLVGVGVADATCNGAA